MVTKKAASEKKSAKKNPPAKKRTTQSRSDQQSKPETLSSNQVALDDCGIATYEGNTLTLMMSEEECLVIIDITIGNIHIHCVWNGSDWVCD
jgi:hypothetical protein